MTRKIMTNTKTRKETHAENHSRYKIAWHLGAIANGHEVPSYLIALAKTPPSKKQDNLTDHKLQ